MYYSSGWCSSSSPPYLSASCGSRHSSRLRLSKQLLECYTCIRYLFMECVTNHNVIKQCISETSYTCSSGTMDFLMSSLASCCHRLAVKRLGKKSDDDDCGILLTGPLPGPNQLYMTAQSSSGSSSRMVPNGSPDDWLALAQGNNS